MRLAAALAAFALLCLPAQAQTRRPAGHVVAVEAPAGAPAPVVRREGQPIEAQVWTPLFSGDAVEAQAGAAVVIETAKDKRLRVDAARSPHRVEGEMGGRFAALAQRLGDLFRARPDAAPTHLVGRSDPPPRFALGAGAAQIVPPGAPLWIAWSGGTAPFTLELRGRTGRGRAGAAALASATTDRREAALTAPSAAAGRLTLALRDAEGREARLALRAGPAPAPPRWIAEAASPQTAALAQAVTLLDARPPRYDLHAAGLVAGRDDDAARALLARLARGERAP